APALPEVAPLNPQSHNDEGSLGSVDLPHPPPAPTPPADEAALFPPEPMGPAPEFFDGGDWSRVPNPEAKRDLNVSLTLTLTHTSTFVDEVATKRGEPPYIRSVCFSPDGKYLATGAEDDQLRVWDVSTKQVYKNLDGRTKETIHSLNYSFDGRLLVSGSGDGTVRVWGVETDESKVLRKNEFSEDDTEVTSVSVSPDGRLVAGGSLDGLVRIWEIESGALVECLNRHRNGIYTVVFMPDSRRLVSGSLDRTVKLWDLGDFLSSPHWNEPLPESETIRSGWKSKEGSEKGSICMTSFSGHKEFVLSVAVSPGGEWIASGSKDRCVRFWDPKAGQEQLMLGGHKNSVISVDFSPAGGLLATGSADWDVRIWNYHEVQ
ncbi:general transcription repressor, partial [Ceratobasidium sp. 392]